MDFPNNLSVYFVIDINHKYKFIYGVSAFNSIVKLHIFVFSQSQIPPIRKLENKNEVAKVGDRIYMRMMWRDVMDAIVLKIIQ